MYIFICIFFTCFVDAFYMYVVYIACIFSDLIYLICNMALNNPFHLIEFEDGIQIIPEKWIQKNTNKCWYPNYKTDQYIIKAIKRQQTPQDDWLMYPIKRVFGVYGK